MTNIVPRDQNFIPVASAYSGTSVEPLLIDDSTGRVLIQAADAVGSAATGSQSRDQNFVPTQYGVSSVDGITLVPIKTDADGRLMVDLLIE